MLKPKPGTFVKAHTSKLGVCKVNIIAYALEIRHHTTPLTRSSSTIPVPSQRPKKIKSLLERRDAEWGTIIMLREESFQWQGRKVPTSTACYNTVHV